MKSTAHIKSHPIHPMLVCLPIGLWVGSLAFDLLSLSSNSAMLRASGFYCIIAGCVGATLAAVPGVIDLFGSVPPNSSGRQRGYLHGGLNTAILLLFIFIAWRRGSAYDAVDGLSVALSFIAVVALGVSGWLGGTLSYRNQIGVDRRYANSTKLKVRDIDDYARPVCNQSELSDGQMMLVRISGDRIAVARSHGELFAFADHCSHKGGPLCDGSLINGTVQCPWHGSQFDCRTGRVVAGPAEQHIRTYQVDLRNGEVFIRNPQEVRDNRAA